MSKLTRATTRGATLFALLLAPVLVQAQTTAQLPEEIKKEAWLTPPPDIAKVVLAPRHLNVSLNNPSPNRKQFLRTVTENMPSQAIFAKPHYYLGGLQVDWKANRARALTTRGADRIEVLSPIEGKTITIAPPAGATLAAPQWSPDGSQVAYIANFDDASHIYVADAATGKSKRITKTPLVATLITQPEWSNNKRIFATVIPDGRGAPPVEPAVPPTPQVRVTTPDKNPQRTYNTGGLLVWPVDQDRLEYYTTSQLVAIDVASGAVTKIGQPAMFQSLDASPDGNHVRVTIMQKPFSYIVPTTNFGTVEELWSVDGKIKVQLAKRALRDGSPADTAGQSTRVDRRNLQWRPDGSLTYLMQEPAPPRAQQNQQQNEQTERPQQPQRRRDRLFVWTPPFDSTSAKVVYESDTRMGNVRFAEDPNLIFVTEGAAPGGGPGGGNPFGVPGDGPQGQQNQQVHEYAVYLNAPTQRYTIARYRSDDFYNLPGTLITKRALNGTQVVQTTANGQHVFLQGTQYSRNPQQEAPRTFVDKVEIKTGQKQRIFQGATDAHETVELLLDDDGTQMIIERQSPTQTPDAYLRDANGQTRKLTNNRDFNPEITNAPRRLVEVTRADGFKFWVRVTLPPNQPAGVKPPAMFWFYPREFDTQDAYDRTNRAYNKNMFPNVSVRDMDILTKLGYAVVEPDAPITGPQGRMNDNYVNDLRNNLAAVIDELDRQGYIDRTRLGVGGHSYGGFSTVNAMVHTPFFKAGIAGDGNYNRTLTPNAFQSERRLLWEARETYLQMSPILYANNLSGALLMYHGLNDMNVGTDPVNAIRLFNALEGLGKTAALYYYPFEDHGPATKETNLDMWARWVAWLETYVKNAGAKPKVTTEN